MLQVHVSERPPEKGTNSTHEPGAVAFAPPGSLCLVFTDSGFFTEFLVTLFARREASPLGSRAVL